MVAGRAAGSRLPGEQLAHGCRGSSWLAVAGGAGETLRRSWMIKERLSGSRLAEAVRGCV